jgi:kynurenine 3-monooxygenase
MALINQDHSFTLTLYLDQNGNKFGFGYLDSAAKVKEYFATYFADVIALIPDLESSFLANPVGKLGTVRTDTWFNKDKVVLLGDASHAIVPFFGQGMNSGFQDVTIIKDLWTEYKDWAKVFPKFYEIQKPNADAIADMALENFVEMSDKVGDKHFLMQKKVESILSKSFPREYISRYSLVMYGQTPYKVCKQAGVIQKEILKELCHGLETAEEVDLDLAKKLIQAKLLPFYKQWNVGESHE